MTDLQNMKNVEENEPRQRGQRGLAQGCKTWRKYRRALIDAHIFENSIDIFMVRS